MQMTIVVNTKTYVQSARVNGVEIALNGDALTRPYEMTLEIEKYMLTLGVEYRSFKLVKTECIGDDVYRTYKMFPRVVSLDRKEYPNGYTMGYQMGIPYTFVLFYYTIKNGKKKRHDKCVDAWGFDLHSHEQIFKE